VVLWYYFPVLIAWVHTTVKMRVTTLLLLLLPVVLVSALTPDERINILNDTIISLTQRLASDELRIIPIGAIVLLPYSAAVQCPAGFVDLYPTASGNSSRVVRFGAPLSPAPAPNPTLDVEVTCDSELNVDTEGFEKACRYTSSSSGSLSAPDFRRFSDSAYYQITSYFRACIKT
jgi:hypothetical protein